MIHMHIGPMIWAGDFNTWSRSRKKFLEDIAYELWLTWLQPNNDTRFLKLDHVLYRGIEPTYAEVITSIWSSDHYPVIAGFRINID